MSSISRPNVYQREFNLEDLLLLKYSRQEVELSHMQVSSMDCVETSVIIALKTLARGSSDHVVVY